EQVTERRQGQVLEIYTPVFRNNRVVGVIELYEADESLFRDIRRQERTIWLLVVSAGVLLYVLLFYIFYSTQRRIRETNRRLVRTSEVTIYALAYQAGLRDLETGQHLERTSKYVELLAQELMKFSPYRRYLSGSYIRDLVMAAPLHDIGKVGIPDSILLKPGPLTPEERAVMEQHCEYGARVLREAESRLPFQSFLSLGVQLCLGHHEKWDGAGYPRRLKGEDIPLSGRIMALADVYDALRSHRPYKKAFSHDHSRRIILEGTGVHFDPYLVEAFRRVEAEFEKISIQMADV
ncbi:MAG: HD domain-containing phosphohydrolase, partial [Thermodesulfobacteriota bacterium]